MFSPFKMELPQEIIAVKRDGGTLSRAQIQQFVEGVVSGDFRDYQASALLMAIVLNGMHADETADLTEAMMRSGRRVTLDEIQRPKVDKHSTGGVGDKVSLVLAPLVAAAGLCVPMMSGRGLGHTGGTLDKLESIPGFSVSLGDAAYRAQLGRIHQAMIGQSADMVPADRVLYALRDVTGTVESIPLICASILSKKLAEGIDALVLDVKCGAGAFMSTEADARELAKTLVRISTAMGTPTTALLTRMDQPLGRAVGNALEVIESIDCLKGQGPEDLMRVTYALGAEMLQLGGIRPDRNSALALLKDCIENGAALAAFRDLVEAQGGDLGIIEDYGKLPTAPMRYDFCYEGAAPAYMAVLDAKRVGEAARLLGAGRSDTEGDIDPSVGFVFDRKCGDALAAGDRICRIYYSNTETLEPALDRLRSALSFSDSPVVCPDVLIDRMTEDLNL